MATRKVVNKKITTEDAVAFVLESDFSDAESTWGMDTDEEEILDDLLMENEFEIPDQRLVILLFTAANTCWHVMFLFPSPFLLFFLS